MTSREEVDLHSLLPPSSVQLEAAGVPTSTPFTAVSSSPVSSHCPFRPFEAATRPATVSCMAVISTQSAHQVPPPPQALSMPPTWTSATCPGQGRSASLSQVVNHDKAHGLGMHVSSAPHVSVPASHASAPRHTAAQPAGPAVYKWPTLTHDHRHQTSKGAGSTDTAAAALLALDQQNTFASSTMAQQHGSLVTPIGPIYSAAPTTVAAETAVTAPEEGSQSALGAAPGGGPFPPVPPPTVTQGGASFVLERSPGVAQRGPSHRQGLRPPISARPRSPAARLVRLKAALSAAATTAAAEAIADSSGGEGMREQEPVLHGGSTLRSSIAHTLRQLDEQAERELQAVQRRSRKRVRNMLITHGLKLVREAEQVFADIACMDSAAATAAAAATGPGRCSSTGHIHG